MARFDSPLKNLKIASPCSANWEEMFGNERKRFCGDCKLNVYNLSGMTSFDAENLLNTSEGRVCVRYFQRRDGTVITADCPVGWARVKHRMSVAATAVFSMLFAFLGSLATVTLLRAPVEPVLRILLPFDPSPHPVMGAMDLRLPYDGPTN